MWAYSLDLRKKIVESVKKGVCKSETARRFGVDRATLKRYCKRLDEQGTLKPRKAPGKAPKLDEMEWGWARLRSAGRWDASRGAEKKIYRGSRARRVLEAALWRMEVGRVDPGRLVFVDEMGTHTSLAPLYGYAPVGERAFFEIPRNRAKNTALLCSLHVPEQ
jgi:transposase